MLCTGEQQGIFAGSLDIPSAGAWKATRHFCRVLKILLQLEPGKIVVCARVFCWLLVKKLISQKTLLGVVICASENWVAVLFQDSLVLCSVECKGWPLGTILVWRLGPRARALQRCCLDSFWVRARADLERSNHITKSLRIIFSKHK